MELTNIVSLIGRDISMENFPKSKQVHNLLGLLTY